MKQYRVDPERIRRSKILAKKMKGMSPSILAKELDYTVNGAKRILDALEAGKALTPTLLDKLEGKENE
jgi:predicted ArsR family transcriptional regulator